MCDTSVSDSQLAPVEDEVASRAALLSRLVGALHDGGHQWVLCMTGASVGALHHGGASVGVLHNRGISGCAVTAEVDKQGGCRCANPYLDSRTHTLLTSAYLFFAATYRGGSEHSATSSKSSTRSGLLSSVSSISRRTSASISSSVMRGCEGISDAISISGSVSRGAEAVSGAEGASTRGAVPSACTNSGASRGGGEPSGASTLFSADVLGVVASAADAAFFDDGLAPLESCLGVDLDALGLAGALFGPEAPVLLEELQ